MTPDFPSQLAEIVARWRDDPELFVAQAFSWGEPGALLNETGPDVWIDDYGEDSDFVRVRVKGEFPRFQVQ